MYLKGFRSILTLWSVENLVDFKCHIQDFVHTSCWIVDEWSNGLNGIPWFVIIYKTVKILV